MMLIIDACVTNDKERQINNLGDKKVNLHVHGGNVDMILNFRNKIMQAT